MKSGWVHKTHGVTPPARKVLTPRPALLAQHWTATRTPFPARGSRQSAELPPREPGILPLCTAAPQGLPGRGSPRPAPHPEPHVCCPQVPFPTPFPLIGRPRPVRTDVGRRCQPALGGVGVG